MPWSIAWTPRALRDFTALEGPERERILAKLVASCDNPERFFQRLKGSRLYRLRVGDRRFVALLVFKHHVIEVRGIGHRSTVYDR